MNNNHELIDPLDLKTRLNETTQFFKKELPHIPKLVLVLGSGWGKLADAVAASQKIPYQNIPHFIAPTVLGHSGQLVVGTLAGVNVAVLQGRVHYYEGHPMHQVVHAVRSLAHLGSKNFVLTNAAGGLHPAMKPGDFMVINDHMNFMGNNPLMGPNAEFLGTRFPDLTRVWDADMSLVFKAVLREQGVRHSEGTYMALSGPTFETPAEIRAYQKLGADAVGMSTVPEAIALRHMGCRVSGISCITNLGAGLMDVELSHDDVSHTAKSVEALFIKFFQSSIERLSKKGLL